VRTSSGQPAAHPKGVGGFEEREVESESRKGRTHLLSEPLSLGCGDGSHTVVDLGKSLSSERSYEERESNSNHSHPLLLPPPSSAQLQLLPLVAEWTTWTDTTALGASSQLIPSLSRLELAFPAPLKPAPLVTLLILTHNPAHAVDTGGGGVLGYKETLLTALAEQERKRRRISVGSLSHSLSLLRFTSTCAAVERGRDLGRERGEWEGSRERCSRSTTIKSLFFPRFFSFSVSSSSRLEAFGPVHRH